MLDLIKQDMPFGGRFNDMTDFDIEVAPGLIFDDLMQCNEEMFEGKWTVEHKENKCIKLTNKADAEDESGVDTIVKVKFYKITGEKTRVRFVRKQGDIMEWATTFTNMKESYLDSVLLQTQEAALVV
jgi:hypothetical protein